MVRLTGADIFKGKHVPRVCRSMLAAKAAHLANAVAWTGLLFCLPNKIELPAAGGAVYAVHQDQFRRLWATRS